MCVFVSVVVMCVMNEPMPRNILLVLVTWLKENSDVLRLMPGQSQRSYQGDQQQKQKSSNHTFKSDSLIVTNFTSEGDLGGWGGG